MRELLEGVRRDESIRVLEPGEGKRYHIKTGDHAQITVVDDIRGDAAHVGQRVGGDDSETSWWSAIESWRFISIACGFGAVLLAVLILLLPSNEWRMVVGGMAALYVLVTTYMLSLNPARYYRRRLSYVLAAGVLANALAFSFHAYLASQPVTSWFHWDGAVSWSFNVAWAVIVGLLVWGDLKQSA